MIKAVNRKITDQIRNNDIRSAVGTLPIMKFVARKKKKKNGMVILRIEITFSVARAYNMKMETVVEVGGDQGGDGLKS